MVYLDGQMISAKEVAKDLAKLPSRDVLLVQFVGDFKIYN